MQGGLEAGGEGTAVTQGTGWATSRKKRSSAPMIRCRARARATRDVLNVPPDTGLAPVVDSWAARSAIADTNGRGRSTILSRGLWRRLAGGMSRPQRLTQLVRTESEQLPEHSLLKHPGTQPEGRAARGCSAWSQASFLVIAT